MSLRWRTAQKFELKWWENYLANKPVDEYLLWKKKYWIDLLSMLQPEWHLDNNMKVLDAGCGPAGIFIAIDKNEVVAIDPLLNNYNSQLSHFDPALYNNVQFENMSLEDFTTLNYFDVCFCMNALNHVNNIKTSITHLVQAAKPKGKIIITIDAHNHPWAKTIFSWLPGDILHPHQHSLNEYIQMLTNAGCIIEKRVFLKSEFWFNHYMIMATKGDS